MIPKIQTRMMTFPTILHITVPAEGMPGRIRIANKTVEGGITVAGMTTAVATEAVLVDLVEEMDVRIRAARKRRVIADDIPPQLLASKKSLLLKSHHSTRG
jgi:hypothetical protein